MRGRTRTRTPAGGRNSRARAGAGSGDANRSRRTTTAGRRAGAVPAGSRPTPGTTRPARRARHFRKRQPKSNGSAATRGRRQRGARTRGLIPLRPLRAASARCRAVRPASGGSAGALPSGLRSRFLRHRRPAPSGRGPPETRCAPCRPYPPRDPVRGRLDRRLRAPGGFAFGRPASISRRSHSIRRSRRISHPPAAERPEVEPERDSRRPPAVERDPSPARRTDLPRSSRTDP